MKLMVLLIGIFSLCAHAENIICKYSPVTLNNKLDWESYSIVEWHNCIGELKQNYGNKKKWIGMFKDGLPNGYGSVKYENWDGYYEGILVDGKMHGKGKYMPYKGEKFDLNCLDNNCKKVKEDNFYNKDENLKNFPDKTFLKLKKEGKVNKIKDQRNINIISNNTFSHLNYLPMRKIYFNNKKHISVIKPLKHHVKKPFMAYK